MNTELTNIPPKQATRRVFIEKSLSTVIAVAVAATMLQSSAFAVTGLAA